MTAARQLSLLPSPPAKEREVHIAIARLLGISRPSKTPSLLNPGWLAWHTPNGEYRTEKTGGLLAAMGTLPGVSDFILVAPPTGRIHALELKRRGCKPTEAQYQFLQLVEEAGGETAWVDSFDTALRVLRNWGAVRVAA